MRQSLESSIAAARWLGRADAAAVAQLRMLAAMLDEARAVADTRTALRLHPQLTKALAESGLTPRVRLQLELRASKIQAATTDAAVDGAANVTRLPAMSARPPKTRR